METKKYKVVFNGYTDLVECDSVNFHKSGTVYFLSEDKIIGSAPPQAYVMLETTDKKVFVDELLHQLNSFLDFNHKKAHLDIEKYKEEGHNMDSAAISFRRGQQTIIEALNLLIIQGKWKQEKPNYTELE